MHLPADVELLEQAVRGSREALSGLAERYAGFVYASALRQVRDRHLAEDVAQAVFLILERKVHRLRLDTLMHAWLFSTTRYACRNALKMKSRREHHETIAAAQRPTARVDSKVREELSPLLDEALAALREADRRAVLLSYFGGRSWEEVGAAIGISADAARKRVERAVGRMRRFFLRRGASATPAAVVAILSSEAQATAPPALVQTVTASVLGASAGGAPALIAKGAVQMMTWAHMKAASVAIVVLTSLLGGASAMVMRQTEKSGAPAVSAKDSSAPVATLDNGVTVELVAIARLGDNDRTWWNGDGSPSLQKFDDFSSQDDPPHSHQIIVRIRGSTDYGASYLVPTSRGWSSGPATQDGAELEGMHFVSFRIEEGLASSNIRVNIAAGEWETLVSHAGGRSVMIAGDDRGNAALGPLIDSDGQAAVTVCDLLENHERRFVAVDQNGNEHLPVQRMGGSGGKMHLTSVTFPLPADEVTQVRLMARPFDRFVEFQDVSLAAGKRTEPKVRTNP